LQTPSLLIEELSTASSDAIANATALGRAQTLPEAPEMGTFVPGVSMLDAGTLHCLFWLLTSEQLR